MFLSVTCKVTAQDNLDRNNISVNLINFGKYCFTDKGGNRIFDETYDYAYPFNEHNLAIVKKDGYEYAIDLSGKIVSPLFYKLKFLDEVGLYQGTLKGGNQLHDILYDPSFNRLIPPTQKDQYLITVGKLKNSSQYLCTSGNLIFVIDGVGTVQSHLFLHEGGSSVSIKPCNMSSFDENRLLQEGYTDQNVQCVVFSVKKTYDEIYKLVDYKGKELIPFTKSKKFWKQVKSMTPIVIELISQYKKEKGIIYTSASDAKKINDQLAETIYPSLFYGAKSVFIASEDINSAKNRTTKMYYLAQTKGSKTERISDYYVSLVSIGNYYIAQDEKGLRGVFNSRGIMKVPFEYKELSVWSYIGKEALFRVKSNNNYGLINENNEFIIYPDFDEFPNLSGDTGFIVSKYATDGSPEYTIVNKKGIILNPYSYDKVVIDGDNSFAQVQDFKIKLNPNTGEELSPCLQEQLFDYVHSSEYEDYQEQVSDYETVIKIGGPRTAVAYNNIGVLYHNNGNRQLAKQNYKKAIELGNEMAQRNLNKIILAEEEERKIKKQEARREVANSLAELFTSIGELATTINNGGASSSYNNSTNSSNTSLSANSQESLKSLLSQKYDELENIDNQLNALDFKSEYGESRMNTRFDKRNNRSNPNQMLKKQGQYDRLKARRRQLYTEITEIELELGMSENETISGKAQKVHEEIWRDRKIARKVTKCHACSHTPGWYYCSCSIAGTIENHYHECPACGKVHQFGDIHSCRCPKCGGKPIKEVY